MKAGVTGYFDLSGSKGMTLRIYYEETYDQITAKRTVAISKLQVKAEWYPATYYPSGAITIDGQTAVTMNSSSGTHNVRPVPVNEFKDVNGDLGSVSNIESNDDGSKSITITVDVNGWTKDGSGDGNGWSVSGSQTIELTKIYRGLVYIDNGSAFDIYEVYIDNGTTWDKYMPYIDNGSSWDIYS